jgi:hypothetical protein
MSSVNQKLEALSGLSTELSIRSDQLTQEVGRIDTTLAKLHLGVEARVLIDSESELFYGKIGKWGIHISRISSPGVWTESWLFADAPRQLRIMAVPKIPLLLEALTLEAENLLKKVEHARSLAQEQADGMMQAQHELLREGSV